MYNEKCLLPLSKKLRSDQTPWEDKLWYYLRGNRFLGLKFKRQVPIENYIVDFCCNHNKLIIELDGGQHKEKESIDADRDRDQKLETLGYKVCRFNNNDIDSNLDGVLETIRLAIKSGSTSP